MKNRFVYGVAMFLVLLFVYTGESKLFSYPKFVAQMEQSPLFNKPAGWIVWTIPVTELIVALLLIIGKTRRYGLVAATIIMATFTGYVYYITHFNYYIPCTCGGIISSMNWTQHLYFNAATTVLSLAATCIIWFHPPSRKAHDHIVVQR